VLAAAIPGAHAVAGGSLWLAWPHPASLAAGVLLAALGAVLAWRVALLRAATSPRAVEIAADGALTVELADATRAAVPADAPRHVTRHWVVLRPGHAACRTLLVTADMLPPGEFRRLRARAWWGLPAPAAGRPA